jgi:hypothetical protein
MGMSEQVFLEMMKVPSNRLRRLGYQEMESMALIGEDPGYEEWIRAKGLSRYGEKGLGSLDAWRERSFTFFHDCVAFGRELYECAVETDRQYPNPLKELSPFDQFAQSPPAPAVEQEPASKKTQPDDWIPPEPR